MVVYVSPHALNIVAYLNSVGVPAFHTAEGLAAALVAMRMRTARAGSVVPPSVGVGSVGAHSAAASFEGLGHGRLNEAESLALFARHGITPVRHQVVATPAEAEAFARGLATSVVVKVLSRDIAHKSDVGGVRVGVAADDVAHVTGHGWPSVWQHADRGGVAHPGADRARRDEMLLGVTRDRSWIGAGARSRRRRDRSFRR